MFLCLTNHQPRHQEETESRMPMNPLAMLFGGRMQIQSFQPEGIEDMENGESSSPVRKLINKAKAAKKPIRKRIPPETPKDGVPLYLNIEREDVVALIPLRFGGTEIVYLSTNQSAELPEAMGGNKVLQKNRMSILVKEAPNQIASQLGIVAKGA
jgi:hypothetical protein